MKKKLADKKGKNYPNQWAIERAERIHRGDYSLQEVVEEAAWEKQGVRKDPTTGDFIKDTRTKKEKAKRKDSFGFGTNAEHQKTIADLNTGNLSEEQRSKYKKIRSKRYGGEELGEL